MAERRRTFLQDAMGGMAGVLIEVGIVVVLAGAAFALALLIVWLV